MTTSASATAAASIDNRPQFLGHPVGLFLLFLVEMWERFSYYGMRALLVLYLTSPTTGMRKLPPGKPEGFNPGPGWADAAANTLYGWYTGLAYLFPVFGGIIADKLIGTHRSMLVGGFLIMCGHIALAISGMVPHGAGGVAGGAGSVSDSVFIFGLAVIVLGTGHFKPSVSVMVGQLYDKKDPRRDGAFSIFYMGINLGAFLCAFVCGTLGEQVGWHWGFGSAAVGMFLGLALYVWGKRRYLAGIGEPLPEVAADREGITRRAGSFSLACVIIGFALSTLFALAFHFGLVGVLQKLMTPAVTISLALGVFGAAVWFVAVQRPGDRGPVASIFIFMLFNAFFWMAFEQAGSSITIFTDRYTDTSIAGPGSWQMPTSWFQSVNPFFIFVFAPVFAWIWTRLGKRNIAVPQPMKISFGLILLGLGFVVLVLGARSIRIGTPADAGAVVKKAALFYIIAAYFLHTMGELCLSPTGLSYVTKAAPVRFVSLLMGIWFVSSFIANLSAGLIAAQTEKLESGQIKLPWDLARESGSVQADFFFLFVVTSIGAGVLILVLTPLLRRLMRNPND